MSRYKRLVIPLVMACSTFAFSQTPAPLAMVAGPGRIAISDDGNNWDKDGVYTLAMNFGVLTAFGVQRKLVHLEHSTIKCSSPDYAAEMKVSTEGAHRFPDFDTTVIYDAWANVRATIAHFKAAAEKSSATDRFYFLVGGPMEMPWRDIKAVSKKKRQFITVYSHSVWNEQAGACISPSHTWADLKASFAADGVQFVHIQDQNANLGGTGSAKWDWLNTMPANPLFPPEAATWLRSRDWKMNGDVSDNGLTWYVLTGMVNAKPTDYQARFTNPLPLFSEIGAAKMGASSPEMATAESNHLFNETISATYSQNAKILEVKVLEMKGRGSISMYNVRSQKIRNFSLVSGEGQFDLHGTLPGKYFLNIVIEGQTAIKEILIK